MMKDKYKNKTTQVFFQKVQFCIYLVIISLFVIITYFTTEYSFNLICKAYFRAYSRYGFNHNLYDVDDSIDWIIQNE